MVDSSIGYVYVVGSKSDSMEGLGSALSIAFVLGMQVDSDSAYSVTKEFVLLGILQSTEGKFQHYDRWMHSMCTVHEGNPSGNAQIPHKCSNGLIHDLILLHNQILLLYF